MKHSFIATIITALSLLFSLTTNAQSTEPTKTPAWISNEGYWVVESNKKTPKDAIVYFYSNENILVYKEEIKNKKLKLNKKKILLRFKSALEEAVANYEKGTWAHQNNLLTQHLQ